VCTKADNNADRDAKGRQAKGEKSGMFGNGHLIAGEKNGMFGRTGEKHPMFGRTGEKHPAFGKGYLRAGEKNPAVKLREYQIPEIFAKHKAGLSFQKIAKIYGVGSKAIARVVYRRTWKHVQCLEQGLGEYPSHLRCSGA
jgi:hypothetical protein